MTPFRLDERSAGILLHPTSLPGFHGCGDVGPDADRFISWLHAAGARWWQMLPIGPVGYGNSPYSALSAFAGNPLLVSPERLYEDGLLERLDPPPAFPLDRVDYAKVAPYRESLLRKAFSRLEALSTPAEQFEHFRESNRAWLDDFALFTALKRTQGDRSWVEWPAPLRDRHPSALREASASLAEEIRFHAFEQWLFDRHWRALRVAAHAQGIGLIGDLPIFVAHDSADVWAHRELWFLDPQGRPTVVAGVPPDYFSATGQRWGNPLYRWDAMKADGYRWWADRLRLSLERFDVVRLDHFIGFQRYWEIPANEPTAMNGLWRPGPGADLFEKLREELGDLPLIAEDLGLVTPEVRALRDRFGFPGLRILQFAFGTDPQAPDFLPFRYTRNSVVYTGTHDNDTVVGWFNDPGGTRTDEELAKEQAAALEFLGGSAKDIHWSMVRAALLSVSDLAIVPVQDLLGLGGEARMNRPGTTQGNWEWRVRAAALDDDLARRFAALVRLAGRWPKERLGARNLPESGRIRAPAPRAAAKSATDSTSGRKPS